MVKFIDELCNVDFTETSLSETSMLDSNNNTGTNEINHLEEEVRDPAADLATVHTICESYRKELDQMAGSSQGARRLVTTLTILSQHKQYYTNLRR